MNNIQRLENKCDKLNEQAEGAKKRGDWARYVKLRQQLLTEQGRLWELRKLAREGVQA